MQDRVPESRELDVETVGRPAEGPSSTTDATLGCGKKHPKGLEETVPGTHAGLETMPLSTRQTGKPSDLWGIKQNPLKPCLSVGDAIILD